MGRGGQNLYSLCTGERAWGVTHKKQPGRRKAGGGEKTESPHGEDQRGEDGGGADGACRAGGRGRAAREGLPQVPAEERAGAGGGGGFQRNVCMAEGEGLREAGHRADGGAVRHERVPVDSVRGDCFLHWIFGEAPDHGGRHCFPLCFHEPVLHETDQLLLDADIPDREGELLGGVPREHAAG